MLQSRFSAPERCLHILHELLPLLLNSRQAFHADFASPEIGQQDGYDLELALRALWLNGTGIQGRGACAKP
jgi:hypothetical protein